jgi:hypothetical protein
MDSALAGVVVGGLIGISSQFLTATFERRRRWEDARREVYSGYLEDVSVGRRRLQDQLEALLAGRTLTPGAEEERRDARETAIAGWNRVRLVTGSRPLAKAARELQIRVATLNELIEGERPASAAALNEVNKTYEGNRRDYVTAVQAELGLRRLRARFTSDET